TQARSGRELLLRESPRGAVVDLAGAEQRQLREDDDLAGHVQLAEAVRPCLRLKLGARGAGSGRQQHELLAFLAVRHADDGVLGVGPRARDDPLDRRQRDHLAADLREALHTPADAHEALRVDRYDVARVVPAVAALGPRADELAGALRDEVSEHHVRPANDEAAAIRDAFDLLEMPFDARKEAPDGAAPIFHRAVHAENGARLGRAVAFEDSDPELLGPQLPRIVLQLLGAGEHVAHA